MSRLGTNLDVALPTTLEVLDGSDQPVLRLSKRWFTWKVTAED